MIKLILILIVGAVVFLIVKSSNRKDEEEKVLFVCTECGEKDCNCHKLEEEKKQE